MKRTKTLNQLRAQYDRLVTAAKSHERRQFINKLYWRYKTNMMNFFHAMHGTPMAGDIMWLNTDKDMIKKINEYPVQKWVYM